MTAAAAQTQSSDSEPISQDAHFIFIGGNRSRSETLRQAIGSLTFMYTMHYVQNIDNAAMHVRLLRQKKVLKYPDLIIATQASMMPSGPRALARIRANKEMASAPIVVLTSVDDPTMRRSLLKEGVCAVVSENKVGDVSGLISEAIVDGWFSHF